MSLRLEWCTHAAARYAVEHWHYSRSLPAGKTVKVGVWEDDRFTGAIIFGWGATPELAAHHHLPQTQICELCRVALTTHVAPVSRLVAIAVRLLRRQSPGLRLVVSFADADQGHHGGIYQAGGWIYLGQRNIGGRQGFLVRGRALHARQVGSLGWRQSLPWLRAHVDPRAREIRTLGKHKYVLPLDETLRPAYLAVAQPYPKRVRSAENGTAAPTAGDGVIPIRTLQP